MGKHLSIALAAALVFGLLSGCLPTPTPTPPAQPTTENGYPAPGGGPTATLPSDAGYPAPVVSTPGAVAPDAGYPPPGGPAGAPALDNRSRVTATLVDRLPDPQNGEQVILRVVILTSEDVEGMPNRTADLVGQTVDLTASAAALPELAAGDALSAEVIYRGDEQGGKFFAENITK